MTGRVIATEKEPSKASRARELWAGAGEADLLETLQMGGMPGLVGLLLLGIWAPMALPTLRVIKPRLREGATILTGTLVWHVQSVSRP